MKIFAYISFILSVIVLIIEAVILHITSLTNEDYRGWGLYLITFMWCITALLLVMSY